MNLYIGCLAEFSLHLQCDPNYERIGPLHIFSSLMYLPILSSLITV